LKNLQFPKNISEAISSRLTCIKTGPLENREHWKIFNFRKYLIGLSLAYVY